MSPGRDQCIFITGGTGFLGSYIIRTLIKLGYTNIRALYREHSSFELLGAARDRVKWIKGDLLDYETVDKGVRDSDVVIHSAAVIGFHKSIRSKMYRVNVAGTRLIANCARHYGIKHFIHISSVGALGKTKFDRVIDEDMIFQNSALDTYYGYTKFESELEVRRAEAEGLPISIINPSLIMGSGFWSGGTAKLFKTIFDSLHFYPLGSAGYVDVRDVAAMVSRNLEYGPTAQRIICSGHNLSHREVINKIADALQKPRPRIALKDFSISLAWRLEMLKSMLTRSTPLITKETLTTSRQLIEYDNSRSKDIFDFNYRPIDETIRETSAQLLEASKNDFIPMYLPI